MTLYFRAIGRVQGVGFRAWTCRAASTLGVTGWVRNLTDGTVEGVAAGAPEDLDQLVAALRRGPRHAVVHDLRLRPAPDPGATAFVALPTADPP